MVVYLNPSRETRKFLYKKQDDCDNLLDTTASQDLAGLIVWGYTLFIKRNAG